MAKRATLVAVVVVLVAVGLLDALTSSHEPSTPARGLSATSNAQSTALYCTGLTSSHERSGRVVFLNTTNATRTIDVTVVADTGATWRGTLDLAAGGASTLRPAHELKGASYGVSALVDGGGVVADEVALDAKASVPCVAATTTRWFGSGFDTLVGSSAELSLYNPSATATVANLTLYSATGVARPDAWQGIEVAPHSVREVDLGQEAVNTTNVALALHVLRGSLAVVGVQDSGGLTSLEAGQAGPSKTAWLAQVTTSEGAKAELRVANPTAATALVNVAVTLGHYHVSAQRLRVAPYSTGVLTLTPNSAIPAAGLASIAVRATVPVAVALATGGGQSVALTSPSPPSSRYVVRNVSGLGFGSGVLFNTSSRTLTYEVTAIGSSSAPVHGTLGAHVALNLLKVVPVLATSTSTFEVALSSPDAVFSLTLPGRPIGVRLVVPLDGR